MNIEGARSMRGSTWVQPLLQALAQPPADALLWVQNHTEVLKDDAHSRVGLVQLLDQPCYLKLYLSKSRWQHLGFRLGVSRALRSFDRAAELLAREVPVPEPRACLLLPEGMLLLTEAIAGGLDLKAMWQDGLDCEEGVCAMRAAGLALGELHSAGYAHGDCKWSNLLWSQGRIFLADLEAVRRARPGSQHMLRDLARFTLNGEDLALPEDLYEEFLQTYLRCTGQQRDATLAAALPLLRELRSRHAARYGERGHQLLSG